MWKYTQVLISVMGVNKVISNSEWVMQEFTQQSPNEERHLLSSTGKVPYKY